MALGFVSEASERTALDGQGTVRGWKQVGGAGAHPPSTWPLLLLGPPALWKWPSRASGFWKVAPEPICLPYAPPEPHTRALLITALFLDAHT